MRPQHHRAQGWAAEHACVRRLGSRHRQQRTKQRTSAARCLAARTAASPQQQGTAPASPPAKGLKLLSPLFSRALTSIAVSSIATATEDGPCGSEPCSCTVGLLQGWPAGLQACAAPQIGRTHHPWGRRWQRTLWSLLSHQRRSTPLTQLVPREVVDVQEVVALGGRADVLAAVERRGGDLGGVAPLAHRRRRPGPAPHQLLHAAGLETPHCGARRRHRGLQGGGPRAGPRAGAGQAAAGACSACETAN